MTFAAGMAVEGLKPFCAIYSTFMQRGYDQVVHDAVLQKLPVIHCDLSQCYTHLAPP